MDFKEIWPELIAGKKVRRQEWNEGLFIQFINEEIQSYLHYGEPFAYDNSILLSDDWVVIGENENVLYRFHSACEQLALGKAIKLKSWPDTCYLVLDKETNMIFRFKNEKSNFLPTFPCMIAMDWEVIE